MKRIYNIKALFAGFIAISALASCSSYQYTGYDSDGIYSSQEQPRQERPDYTQENYTETSEDALYYKRLFAQQSEQIEAAAQSGMIFTDVDSYTSTGNYDDETYQEGSINYTGGQPGWGDHPDEIAINIYQDPFLSAYGPYAGFYGYGYGYGGFYGAPWHRYGFNRFGYSPWGPRFGYGSLYGPGFYSPWGWNRHWGGGWNHWAYANPYTPYGMGMWQAGSYYNTSNVAYNNGRRNVYSGAESVNTRRSLNTPRSSRVGDYSTARDVRTARSNRTSDRTYSTRTTRVESPQSRARRTASYRSSDSRSYENNTRARTVRESRSNTYSNQVRRSTNSSRSSRSSGTVRSSSSSSRSSGTSSGSSRGSRGRGN